MVSVSLLHSLAHVLIQIRHGRHYNYIPCFMYTEVMSTMTYIPTTSQGIQYISYIYYHASLMLSLQELFKRRGEWFLNHLLICSHILHLNLQSCIYIYILDLMWPIMSLQDLIIHIFPISSCVFISSVGSIIILDLRSSSDQSRSNGLDLVKLNPS